MGIAPDATRFTGMRFALAMCLIPWAHARRDLEELHRLRTPGAREVLALLFRRMLVEEQVSSGLASVDDHLWPAMASAIACAVRLRNASFGYDAMEPVTVPSLWSREERGEVYLQRALEVACATRRLLRVASPQAGAVCQLARAATVHLRRAALRSRAKRRRG